MSQVKSPFLVFQDLIDGSTCDKIAQEVRVEPTIDAQGVPMPMERFYKPLEEMIFSKISPMIPKISEHYTGFKYRGTENLLFQQFPVTGKPAEEPHCENAVYKRKKWIRIKERDLTGVIWLKDFKESSPFDIDTQVLGGKLEFPIYNFGFQAQRGTMVIYPACERFIFLTSPVLVGELQLVRINICGEGLWIYQPDDYPGDFRTWFSDIV